MSKVQSTSYIYMYPYIFYTIYNVGNWIEISEHTYRILDFVPFAQSTQLRKANLERTKLSLKLRFISFMVASNLLVYATYYTT